MERSADDCVIGFTDPVSLLFRVIIMKSFTRAFDQDDIRVMATALDGAWNYLRCRESDLSHPDKADRTRRMLAKRIIAAARLERRKHGELLMSALYGAIRETDFSAGGDVRTRRPKSVRAWSGL
jgi:hypothetical protein